MKIQWLGHSAFRLIESTGTSIVIDPFNPDTVGYKMARCTADTVTISQDNPEHNYVKGVDGALSVINSQGAFEVKGVHIKSIKTVCGDKKNLIFKFRLDGVEVCHLGGISADYDASLIEQIMPVDVLMLPVGGNETFSADDAKTFFDVLMPSVAIPMYYKSKNTAVDIDKLDSFLKLFDDENIVISDSDVIEYDREDFDNFQSLIVVPKRHKN